MTTSFSEVLNMLCNILPLKFQEVLMQQYMRIDRKLSDDLVRALFIQLVDCPVHLDHRIITPVHILKMAIRRTLKNDMNLFIKPLPRHTYQAVFLTAPNVVLVVNVDVGNSKNKSVEQADRSTKVVCKFFTHFLHVLLLSPVDLFSTIVWCFSCNILWWYEQSGSKC